MSDPTPAQSVVLCLVTLALIGVCFGLAKTRASKGAAVVVLAVGAVFLTLAAFATFGGGS